MIGLSYGVRMWADYFVLSGCTRLTDRQTDGQRQKGDSNSVI